MIQEISDKLHTKLDYYLLLRLVACILVIRQHIGFATPEYSFAFLIFGSANSGGQAVVAFFILSAFLMTKGFLQQRYAYTFMGLYGYYKSRIKRIIPLYFIVTIFSIFLFYPYIISLDQYNKYIYYVIELFTLTYIKGLPYWNQVYWTLSVEWLFYIICPLLIYPFFVLSQYIKKYSSKLSSVFLPGLIFGLIVINYGIIYYKPNTLLFQYISNPLLIEFIQFGNVFLIGIVTAFVTHFLTQSSIIIKYVSKIQYLLLPAFGFVSFCLL